MNNMYGSNLRILHVRSSGGFYGAESVILSLAKSSASKGLSSPYIVCLNNRKNPHTELVARAKEAGLQSSAIDCRGIFDLSSVRQIRRLLVDGKFDVLHCHDYKATAFGLLASIGLKMKRVNTNHLWTHGDLKLRLYEVLEGFLFNFFHYIVAVSSPVKREVYPFLINKKKISIIPNGIDCEDFRKGASRSLRSEWDIRDDDVVIGIIGRHTKQKGHEYLFYAINKLIKECPDLSLKLLVVGHGELEPHLKKLAEDLGISENVLFAGVQEDIKRVYGSINIFAIPSLSEGLPMALLEAMCAGVPVVATPVGDIPALIQDGETGLIVEPRDIDQLKDAIKKYIKMGGPERNKIISNARMKVEREYSAGSMAEKYSQIYDMVVNSKKTDNKKPIYIFILGILLGVMLTAMFLRTGSEFVREGTHEEEGVVSSSKGLLSSFEGDDPVSWDGQGIKTQVVKGKQCSSGKCLKVTYPKGDYPGLGTKRLPADWTGFDTLEFDAFNPYDSVIKFGVLIKDIPGGHGYSSRYDGQFALKPGENHFVLNITALETNDHSRKMDVSQIMDLVIFLVNPDRKTTLYLDNMRLSPKQSNKAIKEDGSKDFSATSGNKQTSSEGGPKILNSFEGKDTVRWAGVKTKIVSDEHCVSGNCLKAVYPKGSYPGMSGKRLPSDWSGYDTFRFDVYNSQDYVIKFGILIRDIPGGDGYPSRYDGQFAFKPGKNQFVLNITGLRTNDHSRQIDTSQIKDLIIFLVNPDVSNTLYFDNIRLETDAGLKSGGLTRFDFGTDSSEVWPGFTQVTDKTLYAGDLGYGWEDIGGLRSDDRRYPDALFRDWVRGNGTFKVDVANGEYVVYMMLEDPGFWDYYQNYNERRVFVEDQLVIDQKLPLEAFFKDYYFAHMNHEDLPGEDIFANYVNKRFVWRKFKTPVNDEQLTLRFSSADAYANTLSALIVAPAENDPAIKGYLEKLNSERRAFFNGRHVETKKSAPEINEDLRRRFSKKGFVPFIKNYNDPMFPTDVPTENQVKDKIILSVAQNEYEPFVTGFYPLEFKGGLSVSISDLKNDEGGIFSSSNIKINSVQYKIKLKADYIYTMRGELLRDNNKIDLSSGVTRYKWFTVHVPKGTVPGIYKGKITIVDDGVGSGFNIENEFTLQINILPFQLAEPDVPVGLFYAIPPQYDWYPAMKIYKWTAIERQLKDMRDHGLNTMGLSFSPGIIEISDNGYVKLDFKFFDEFLRAYKQFGFNKPISGYGLIALWKGIERKTEGNEALFQKAILSTFSQINAHAKMLSGNEIVIGVADEVSNTGGEGIDSIKKVATILKNAGLNVTGYFNYKKDRQIFPYLKTVTINNGLEISDALMRYAQGVGTDVWFYNIGQGRFTFGYYLWKTKAKGRLQWHYQLPAVDPYFDLDGRESDYCASYPSLQGPINAVWFELVREGIDDYRYLKTLENLVKTTGFETNNLSLKQEALDLLMAINSDISFNLKENEWSLEQYQEYRDKISQVIGRIYGMKQ